VRLRLTASPVRPASSVLAASTSRGRAGGAGLQSPWPGNADQLLQRARRTHPLWAVSIAFAQSESAFTTNVTLLARPRRSTARARKRADHNVSLVDFRRPGEPIRWLHTWSPEAFPLPAGGDLRKDSK
jgi:hypothetical protein